MWVVFALAASDRVGIEGNEIEPLDIFDCWPDADEIGDLDDTLGRLGDIGSVHFVHVLVDHVVKTRRGEEPGVPVDYWSSQDWIELAEGLGLVAQYDDRWVLTELGEEAGRLYTCLGDPPDGIELRSWQMDANRQATLDELTRQGL